MKAILRLKELAEKLVGRIDWKPPEWAHRLRGFTPSPPRVPEPVRRFVGSHRKALTASMATSVVLVAGGCWLMRRPKPDEISVRSSTPSATRLAENEVPDTLEIAFGGSAARLEQVGKPVTKGILMKPALPGEWQWIRDNELRFTLASGTDWPVDQDISVWLDKSLFPARVHLQTYTVNFHSPQFVAGLSDTQLYQDPTDPKVKQVISTVHFSHPVDPKELESRVKITLAGRKKPLSFTVSYDKWKGEAYIHSETVEIPAEDTTATVAVGAGVRSSRGGNALPVLSGTVEIPGLLSFFHINSVEPVVVGTESYEPQQVLIVETSTAVREKDMAKGLTLKLLPKDLPPLEGEKGVKNYDWEGFSVERMDSKVLSLSSSLSVSLTPLEHDSGSEFSFTYQAPERRYLYLKIPKGLVSFGGYILAKDYETILRVPRVPDELKILHQGAILSLKGEKKLTVISRGLDAVRFQVGRVLPDRINHLVSQTEGDFRQPSFLNSSFGDADITERKQEVRPIVRDPRSSKPQYTALDLAPYLAGGKRGLFFVGVNQWNPATKRAGSLSDWRFVVVTDLGLLVKDDADGSHDVFVQSLHDGKPVRGATVEILGRNSIPLVSETTDERGHARFPSVSDFKAERQPVAWVVHTAEDLSFLPFAPRDRMLDVSRFDVGGATGRMGGEGLSAFLFSDRGLYRPGDEFRVGLIVKHPDWSRSLAGIPLEVAVRDARGLEVWKKKIVLSEIGFDEIRYTTQDTSPTGTWDVGLYLIGRDGRRGELLGDTKIRVEEFLPDRMRIAVHFSEERADGWVKPDDLSARVHLENLFGTPAENRRVTAGLTLSPGFPSFATWREYRFFDPLKQPHEYSEELPEATTDDAGDAAIPLGLEKMEKATYRASLVATGFEAEGGRGVSGAASVLVSPEDHLVGFKADGDLSWIPAGTARTLDLIAVDPKLARVPLPGLTATLLEERWVSVLMKQSNGTWRYESKQKEVPQGDKPLSLGAKGPGPFALDTTKPGDFVLVLTDKDGTELLRVPYTVAGRANVTRSLEKNSELGLRLSRNDYAPGDDVEVEIKAPYTGAGLITLERDHVYAFEWFQSTTTSTVQKIKLPTELEGNGYLSVSFLRAPDSPEIYTSPLSYGVAAFSVSRARRMNSIELTGPDKAQPGSAYPVSYRTKNPGKIVVYAVDEGILQVAQYKTPDPLGWYFRKRALEVRTLQILDLLLPEFSLAQRLAGTGGDEEAKAAVARNLNPFKRKQDKPLAFWSGIVDSGPEPRTLSIPLPDYFNGTMRLMAVAVGKETMGATERAVIVRGPFVLSPNLPTTVAPGDRFTASVGVSNGEEGSGKDAKQELTVTVSGPLTVGGSGKQALAIPESHESSASVEITAGEEPGAATVTFVVAGNGKSAKRTVGLSVRPAIPYMTDVEAGSFDKGEVKAPVARRMRRQLRTLEVSASPLPISLGPGLAKYLEEYPYGCTEQLVSKAFPALVLRNKPEFGYAPAAVQANLDRTVEILRGRQNAQGAFGFWAANSYVSDYQSVYAVHFLTEAKESGYPVPQELLSRGLSYLRELTASPPGNLSDARTRAYALYVLTRNGVVTGQPLETLTKKVEGLKIKGWQKDITAGYLAATHALLKQQREADSLMKGMKLGEPVGADYRTYYDSLSRNGQLLYLISRHFPERIRTVEAAELEATVDPLFHGTFNTISSSFTLLGLSAYTDAVGPHASADLTIDEITPKGETIPVVLPKGLFPRVEFSDQASQIRFAKKEPGPAFWEVTEAGFDQSLPTQPIVKKLEVQREYHDLKGHVITSTSLGEEIEVHLKIRSVDQGGYPNIAVVDLLPGGFEVVMNQASRGESEENGRASSARHRGEEEGDENEGGDEGGGDEEESRPRYRDEESEGEGDSGEGNESEKHSTEAGADTYWSSTISQEGSSWVPEYVDVREDRVLLFGEVSPSVSEFVYRIKATNKGHYVTPPPFAESMYDREVRARGLADSMEVK